MVYILCQVLSLYTKGERYKILNAEIGNGIGKPGEIVSDYLEVVCGDKQTIKD